MTAIPPLLQSVDSSLPFASFREGDLVHAQVVEDLGEGKYSLRIGNARITVESALPLHPNERLTLEVVATEERLLLALPRQNVGSPESFLSTPSEALLRTDSAEIPAPFSIAIPLKALSQHLPSLPEGGTLTVALAAEGSHITIHFPDGTPVEGTVVPLATSIPNDDASSAPFPPFLPAKASFQIHSIQFPVTVLLLGEGTIQGNITVPLPAASSLASLLLSEEPLPAMASSSPSVTLSLELEGTKISFPFSISQAIEGKIAIRSTGEAHLSGLWLQHGEKALLAEGVDTLLRAIGLTPTEATRDAANALLAQGVPVDRSAIQSLLALAAGRSGEERLAFLAAGAKLLANEIPLAPPLAAGLLEREGGPHVHRLLHHALTDLTEAQRLFAHPDLERAIHLLQTMAIQLGEGETPQALASFLQTFAREPIGEILASLEHATAALLSERHPLQNLDIAIQALLHRLAERETSQTPSPSPLPHSLPSPILPRNEHDISFPTASLEKTTSPNAGNSGIPLPKGEIAEWIQTFLDAPDREIVERAVQRFAEPPDPTRLRATLDALETLERSMVRRDPAISRIAEAVSDLQRLNRLFLAYKAENLAGLRHDPMVFVAEIPIRFGEENGTCRIQVFRRQGRGRGTSDPSRYASARVVLDLETTNLGPVVGDLLFIRGRACQDETVSSSAPPSTPLHQIHLRFFAADEERRQYLEANAEELVAALREKGFSCSPHFGLIPVHGKEAPAASSSERPTASGRIDLRI